MGRGKQQWGQREGKWRQPSDSSSWQSAGGQQWDRRQKDAWDAWQKGSKQQEEGPTFPSYTAMDLESPAIDKAGTAEKDPAAVRPGDLVRGIQKFVTAARKAEIKARKAEEEREAILGRWQRYQAKLQAAFIKERETYKRDLQKNQAELDKLREAQQDAFMDLKEAFSNPQSLLPKPAEAISVEAAEEWTQLLQGCDEEDVEMTDDIAEKLGRSLKEFLASRMEATPTRRSTKSDIKMTPPRPERKRKSPLPTLDEFMEESMGFTRKSGAQTSREPPVPTDDPYMTSPSRNTVMPSPGLRSSSRTRSGGPRVGVKLLGRKPVPSPKPESALAKRLQRRRQAMEKAAEQEAVTVDTDDEVFVGDLGSKGDGENVE